MKLSPMRKFFKRLGYEKSENNTNVNQNFYNFLGVDANTKEDVLSEATYYACLKVLSEAIGKLPLKLLRYTEKGGVETARDHPLYHIVNSRPNPYMTATTFWSSAETLRNHEGNAYIWIQGAGKDTKLWFLPPNEVEVKYDESKTLAEQPDIYYIYSSGGTRYTLGSEEVLHLKSFHTVDGLSGISVRKQLNLTIGGAIKSQKMLNKMYGSGFTAKAVLNYSGALSNTNTEELIKMTESYARGELSDKGIENIIPIPLGFNLTPFNAKLADSQFIEVKQYTALQIASAFGIKPYQIGDYTKSSYASAEAQQLSFYVDTLLYIVKQYEEELTYKLLSDEEIAKGYHFKFNIDVILRADFATKINTLSTATNSFLMTANEARSKIDLPSVPGGDRLLGNGASIPVELTGSQYIKDEPEETTDESNPEETTEENNEGGGQDNA